VVWLKIDQIPQAHMNQGLRGYVLSLSTGRCTVDVGNRQMPESAKRGRSNVGLSMQDDAPATEVGQLPLEGLDLLWPDSD